jgi:outer membrane receptor protein involved in Fe transport
VQGVQFVPTLQVAQGLTLSGSFTVIDETHSPPAPPAPPLRPVNVRPLRVPRHSASALARYVRDAIFTSGDTTTISLAYTFVGDRDDVDPASSAIRSHTGYHRFDTVVSYSPHLRWNLIRGEEIFARIQNLFDRNYSEAFGFKAPPINAVAGVRLDF